MAFQDRELPCRDCENTFSFTAGEQEFYSTKGLEHDPVRCPSCRAQRKALRPDERETISSYGVYVSWGGRTPRQLHVATCAECANQTEVPFRPRDDRPVYCSDCYGSLRKKQEAQAAAEAAASASRIATAASSFELEGLSPQEKEESDAVSAIAILDNQENSEESEE